MTEEEIVESIAALPGVSVQRPTRGDDVPEIAWGDSFFTVGDGVMPFATLVTKNYPGDAESQLDRPGAFRVNLSVGRAEFERWIGYRPAEHRSRSGEWDYSVPDRVVPHPVYAPQGWVAVVSPTNKSDETLRALIAVAYERAARGRG